MIHPQKNKNVVSMENLGLLAIQENKVSVTKSMQPSKMQPLYTHVNKLVTSFLICILNIAICRAFPEAILAPVSPTR